jgi:hypothetical protein
MENRSTSGRPITEKASAALDKFARFSFAPEHFPE